MNSRLTCFVGEGSIRAELRRAGAVRWMAEATWDSPESLAERVAELAAQAELPVWNRVVTFVLAHELLQVRRLADAPPVRHGQLAALVALAPHRYFRRNGVALVTDAGWEGGRGARVALAVALPDPIGAALVRGAREAGLLVAAIRPAGEGAFLRLSLLPQDEQARREAADLRWTRRLALGAVAAWLLLGTAVGADLWLERRHVTARLDAVRGPLASVLAAQAAEDSAERMVRRMELEEVREGDAVAILFRVATALPDSAFLTQIRVDSAGVGLVAGAARRPAAVLAALEGRARVSTPRFEGRTSRDVVAGRSVERFAIGFGEREAHP